MRLPSEPVVLTVQQVEELNLKLSTLRHDINNHLSLIMAATELIRHKPTMADRMINTLSEQPGKISAAMAKFSIDFEHSLKILRS
jgi:hypothetical protein